MGIFEKKTKRNKEKQRETKRAMTFLIPMRERLNDFFLAVKTEQKIKSKNKNFFFVFGQI